MCATICLKTASITIGILFALGSCVTIPIIFLFREYIGQYWELQFITPIFFIIINILLVYGVHKQQTKILKAWLLHTMILIMVVSENHIALKIFFFT